MQFQQAGQPIPLERVQATLQTLSIEMGTWPTETIATGQELSPQIERELSDLMTRRHYTSYDVVRLTPETPALDEKLAAFEAPHYHSDDEVRICVDGEGVFTIYPSPELGQAIDIIVEPGDLIVVPAETMHSFTLTPKQHITAIRVFKDNPKWEAIYDWPTTPIAHHA
jgi:1,2-dihydroxy-3-keto-5-methylthiopentene dioxygenase